MDADMLVEYLLTDPFLQLEIFLKFNPTLYSEARRPKVLGIYPIKIMHAKSASGSLLLLSCGNLFELLLGRGSIVQLLILF
jgi:hypothetical protein